jgi:stalled ribosome alternative rescue factor ArfA
MSYVKRYGEGALADHEAEAIDLFRERVELETGAHDFTETYYQTQDRRDGLWLIVWAFDRRGEHVGEQSFELTPDRVCAAGVVRSYQLGGDA